MDDPRIGVGPSFARLYLMNLTCLSNVEENEALSLKSAQVEAGLSVDCLDCQVEYGRVHSACRSKASAKLKIALALTLHLLHR